MKSGKIDENKQKVDDISYIFDTMNYGPASDSDETVKDWLSSLKNRLGFFIDGKWQFPDKRETIRVLQISKKVPVNVIIPNSDDVQNAINSSYSAFSVWSQASAQARSRYMHSIVRRIQKRQQLIMILEAVESEKPIYQVKDLGISSLLRSFSYFAGWASLLDSTKRKPIGVVTVMMNQRVNPLMSCWGIAAALAMGNTVLLMPHNMCCAGVLLFAEICTEAGLPPGVVNVVPSNWNICIEAATNPKISKILFNGYPNAAKDLQQKIAGLLTDLSIDIGGRPTVIIFDSADIDSAVESIIETFLCNDRRNYCSGVKVLVQESIQASVIDKIEKRASKIRLGNCLDRTVDMSDLLDTSLNANITEYLDDAKRFGAKIFQAPISINKTDTIPATIVSNIQTASRIVSEAVSGPFVLILPFRTTAEAVSLANNSKILSTTSIWSEKYNVALEVAYQLTSSTIWINSQNLMDPSVTYGSILHTGCSQTGGKQALIEFTIPAWQDYKPFQQIKVNSNFGQKSAIENTIHCKDIEGKKIALSKLNLDCIYQLYYGGNQKKPDKQTYYAVLNKENNIIAYVAEANTKDLCNALQAANNALQGWKNESGMNRAQILCSIAEHLEARSDEFSKYLSEINGESIEKNREEVQLAVLRLFYAATECNKQKGLVNDAFLKGTVMQIAEPLGVIVIVCPNTNCHSFLSFISLIAPAIATGNTVVVIPSQYNSLLAVNMPKIFNDSELPKGIVNILTGDQHHLIYCLSEYRNFNAIWYHADSREGVSFIKYKFAGIFTHIWIGHNPKRNWKNEKHRQGREFMDHCLKYKSIWLPTGDTFQ